MMGSHGHISASQIESCDAMLVSCGDVLPPTQLMMELDALRETGLPVILLAEDHVIQSALQHADVLGLRMASTGAAIAGALAGAVHRSNEVASLLQETGKTKVDHSRINYRLARINRELEDAAQLQKEYLPQPRVTIPGGTVSVLWRPASHVSGDGCAVHKLDSSRTLLFLADAIGHGIPAAMLSVMMQRVLLEAVRQHDDDVLADPASLLEQMNEACCSGNLVSPDSPPRSVVYLTRNCTNSDSPRPDTPPCCDHKQAEASLRFRLADRFLAYLKMSSSPPPWFSWNRAID